MYIVFNYLQKNYELSKCIVQYITVCASTVHSRQLLLTIFSWSEEQNIIS